jgi:hypothetical protein
LARTAGGTAIPTAGRKFGVADLWRMALWGVAAAGALALVAFAATSQIGRNRMAHVAGEVKAVTQASAPKRPREFDAREGQKLAEAIKTLSADYSRVSARVASLERSIDNMSGIVARAEKSQPRPRGPAPQVPTVDEALPIAAAAELVTSSINSVPIPLPAPSPPTGQRQDRPSSQTAKVEFGLDIGGARSLDGLRTLWGAALQRHSAQLDGLQPIIHLRERPRSAGPELRLVAGPIQNAAAAAKLCGLISAAGGICQPALFDGQRLALR